MKVYEINCWNYYTKEGKEVDLNLDLSGVAPSKTLTLKTPDHPMLRTHHSIDLGIAGTPGVWMIEAVANGKRVTCRLHKGSLRVTQETCAAGQLLTVLDENWQPVKVRSCCCCVVRKCKCGSSMHRLRGMSCTRRYPHLVGGTIAVHYGTHALRAAHGAAAISPVRKW